MFLEPSFLDVFFPEPLKLHPHLVTFPQWLGRGSSSACDHLLLLVLLSECDQQVQLWPGHTLSCETHSSPWETSALQTHGIFKGHSLERMAQELTALQFEDLYTIQVDPIEAHVWSLWAGPGCEHRSSAAPRPPIPGAAGPSYSASLNSVVFNRRDCNRWKQRKLLGWQLEHECLCGPCLVEPCGGENVSMSLNLPELWSLPISVDQLSDSIQSRQSPTSLTPLQAPTPPSSLSPGCAGLWSCNG